MMITTLPAGSVFVVRERGSYRAWCLTSDGRHYTGVNTPLKAGDTVTLAVWKRSHLEPRKSYVLKEGDAVWIDTGLKALDLSTPPDRLTGHRELATTIWKNHFVSGPKWLREAT